MQHISRRGIGLLAAGLGLLVLPGTAVAGNAISINITVPNARAAITGTITRHDGGAVKNAAVSLLDPGFGFPSDYTTTDAAGKFAFYIRYTSGTYVVGVDPHGGAPTYESGFYLKTGADHFTTTFSAATQIHYTGTLISGVNIAVQLGHSISGHVHHQVNGAPLKGIGVRATGSSGGSSAVTDTSGNYSIRGLPNGSYHLTLTPPATMNILSGCYRNAPPHNYTADCSGSASNVDVSNADVANRNVDLPDGNLITGNVSDAQGHKLCATISAVSTSNFTVISKVDSCGAFTLLAVPSGNYRVDISRRGVAHFVNGHYAGNVHHWTESAAYKQVHVGNANVNLGTIQPDSGHIISGTIRNSANKAVNKATLSLSSSGNVYSYDLVSTDSNGNFTFFGVGAEPHTIFESAGFSGENMRSGYFRAGAAGSWTPTSEQATALSANTDHSGIVIKAPAGYIVSGRITNAAHAGVSSFVSASGDGSGFAITDAQGNYVMNGLAPGDYTIEVSPGSTATAHYQSGYYSKTAPGRFTADYTKASSIHVGP